MSDKTSNVTQSQTYSHFNDVVQSPFSRACHSIKPIEFHRLPNATPRRFSSSFFFAFHRFIIRIVISISLVLHQPLFIGNTGDVIFFLSVVSIFYLLMATRNSTDLSAQPPSNILCYNKDSVFLFPLVLPCLSLCRFCFATTRAVHLVRRMGHYVGVGERRTDVR